MAVYSIDELLTLALRRAEKKPSTVASPTDEARFLLNSMSLSHLWLNSLAPWEWLRTESEIGLYAILSNVANDGTITAGGTAFNIAGTTYNTTAWIGASALVTVTSSGVKDIMRVATMDANGSGTFTSGWTGTTATAGLATVTMGQDTYALPSNFDKPLATSSYVAAPWNMTAYDPERFQKARSSSHSGTTTFMTSGQPSIYTLWGEGDGAQKLKVWPFPSEAQMLTIKYWRTPTAITSAGSYPDLPEKYQTILIDMALDRWYRDKELDMTKRAIHKAMWQQRLAQMMGHVERSSDRLSVQPADNRSHYA